MPLVACPVCEKKISKRAHACPGCGEPDPLHHLAKSSLISMVLWLLIIAGVGYAAWVHLLPVLIDFVRQY